MCWRGIYRRMYMNERVYKLFGEKHGIEEYERDK